MGKKPTYEELEQRVEGLEKKARERARLDDRMQLLSLSVEQSSEGVAVVDLDGNLEYLNVAFARMHGYTPEELVGKHLSVFHTPQQMPSIEAANRQLKETGDFKGEIWHVTRNGTEFPTLMHNSLIRDATNKPIGMMGTVRDISDIKQAREALRESEEKFRKIFETVPTSIVLLDKDGQIVDINPYHLNHVGKGKTTKENFIGKNIVTHPSIVNAGLSETYKNVLKGEPFDHKDVYFPFLTSGIDGYFNVKGAPILKDDEVIAAVITHENITERVRAEEALCKKEQELNIRNQISRVFLTIPDDEIYGEVLQVVLEAMESPYGTFAYINEDGDRVVPVLTRDIWVECEVQDVGPVFPRERWSGIWGKCLINKGTVSSSGPFRVPEGHIPITRAMAVPIIHQGEAIGNFMVGNKTTDYGEKDKKLLESIADYLAPILHARLQRDRQEKERKKAEESLRKSKEFSFNLLNNSPHPILVINPDTSVRYVNPALETLTGFSSEEIIGRKAPYPWWTEETMQKTGEDLKEAMSKGARKLEKLFQKKNGERFWVEITSVPIRENGAFKYYLANWVDITDRKQTEIALIERGKELENKTHELEEVNAALRVLLKHRDEDKKDLEDKVVANVKKLVFPYIEKLNNSRLNDRQMVYLNIIKSNLEDIITPFLHQLSSKYSDLTPSEIQVAGFVKDGKTTKEIAELLNSSTGAINFHRNNLRKKLGLRNTKTNLRSFLLSLA